MKQLSGMWRCSPMAGLWSSQHFWVSQLPPGLLILLLAWSRALWVKPVRCPLLCPYRRGSGLEPACHGAL